MCLDERISTHLPFPDGYRREKRDPVSDPGPTLRHRSGPSSQFSGPIAGFLACVEDGQRLPLPSALSPRRGPTGLHRTRFPDSTKSRKREFLKFSTSILPIVSVKLETNGKYLIHNCEQKSYYLSSNIYRKGFSREKTDSRCQHTKH